MGSCFSIKRIINLRFEFPKLERVFCMKGVYGNVSNKKILEYL